TKTPTRTPTPTRTSYVYRSPTSRYRTSTPTPVRTATSRYQTATITRTSTLLEPTRPTQEWTSTSSSYPLPGEEQPTLGTPTPTHEQVPSGTITLASPSATIVITGNYLEKTNRYQSFAWWGILLGVVLVLGAGGYFVWFKQKQK
ncbi:MAG TPA: hypothetical protein PLG04_02095, partial [Anaerolineaceae bacterium]|nr:hypothetical protein [Anaerolineaceae bacterium]